MAGETLIHVDSISRYFGRCRAIHDLSFTVKRGEVLGFLGPNGAGKSTTMQILCGVLAASAGSVSIAGHDIVEEARAAKRHIGFLPEHPPLYTELTVDEYLSYCARIRRVPPGALGDALASSKSRCGLEHHGGRLIGNLSKGYQQRVGIAQSIIHSPAAIVLDEPTSGLDPNQIREIRELIRELGTDHSVIVSTHILPEVQSNCHRVLIINQGRLVLDEDIHALGEDDRQASCTVGLHNPPLLEELEDLEGITLAQALDPCRFRITYRAGGDMPEQLARKAASAGWRLFELVPETSSLERTFVRLTSGDYDPPAPGIEAP